MLNRIEQSTNCRSEGSKYYWNRCLVLAVVILTLCSGCPLRFLDSQGPLCWTDQLFNSLNLRAGYKLNPLSSVMVFAPVASSILLILGAAFRGETLATELQLFPAFVHHLWVVRILGLVTDRDAISAEEAWQSLGEVQNLESKTRSNSGSACVKFNCLTCPVQSKIAGVAQHRRGRNGCQCTHCNLVTFACRKNRFLLRWPRWPLKYLFSSDMFWWSICSTCSVDFEIDCLQSYHSVPLRFESFKVWVAWWFASSLRNKVLSLSKLIFGIQLWGIPPQHCHIHSNPSCIWLDLRIGGDHQGPGLG